jgi:diadenosine tetraphosphate (Ap4A) HIT family hydrolase
LESCLFCKFASKAIPVPFVHEDEVCFAIDDIAPRAPVHCLIIPKRHLAGSLEVGAAQESLAGHLVSVAAGLARKRGIDRGGFRLVFNTNPDAGQTVFHLHLHLLGGQPLGPMA